MSDLARLTVRQAKLTSIKARLLAERGLTTVEYAIGLLAAAAAALVLLRIFNDNRFFEELFNWVLEVFSQVAANR